MRRIVNLLVMTLTGAASLSLALAAPEYEVRACNVGFTELGRLAYFAGTAGYVLATDKAGRVADVAVDRAAAERTARLGAFVRLDGLKGCLQTWRLSPTRTYTVTLHAGSTADLLGNWSLTVCDDSDSCLKILLPTCRE